MPDPLLAFLGGCLGALVSALGGFLLFGLGGLIGFLVLAWTHQDGVLAALTGGVLLRPCVCFLGGVVAAGYAKGRGLLRCGKDLGRPLGTLGRLDVVLAGGLGGLAGYGVQRLLAPVLGGITDPVAGTVFLIPLVLNLTLSPGRSSDCAAASHAVASPYRFFERLAEPARKLALGLGVGLGAALLALGLCLHAPMAPYAGLLGFCLSAVSLGLLFLAVPVPATHQAVGPAGAAVVAWMAAHGGTRPDGPQILEVLLWGVAAAQLGLLGADVLGRLCLDRGELHVDPPAIGIVAATAVVTGLLPVLGAYRAPFAVQTALCALGLAACAWATLRGPVPRRNG